MAFSWGAAHLKYLRAHYNQDMSPKQIAEYLGCSRNAVISKANRTGIAAENSRVVPAKPVPWTDAEREKLADMWRKGVMWPGLVNMFKRPQSTIRAEVRRLGLPKRESVQKSCVRQAGPAMKMRQDLSGLAVGEKVRLYRNPPEPGPRQCRHIYGDPAVKWAWCRKERVSGRSWCADHTATHLRDLTPKQIDAAAER